MGKLYCVHRIIWSYDGGYDSIDLGPNYSDPNELMAYVDCLPDNSGIFIVEMEAGNNGNILKTYEYAEFEAQYKERFIND